MLANNLDFLDELSRSKVAKVFGDDALLETTTDSTTVFLGRVFSAEVMDVALSDGRAAKREIVRHNGGAAIVPIDDQQNVYLVRQFRSPFDKVLIEIPAGKLEINENPKDCAERELREETGLLADKIDDLGEILPSPGYCSEVLYLYMATGLRQGPTDPDDGEIVHVVKYPLSDVLAMIDSGTISDAKTVVAILKAARRLNL